MPKRSLADPATLVTERDFQAQVERLLRAHGWKYYHAWRSDHSVAGYPDLTCVRGNRVLWLELKSEKGRTSPEQDAWLDALEAAGAEVYVVYPSGWDRLTRVLE